MMMINAKIFLVSTLQHGDSSEQQIVFSHQERSAHWSCLSYISSLNSHKSALISIAELQKMTDTGYNETNTSGQ